MNGIKATLPILTGVIPFGLVMGTVAANAKLNMLQTMSMNTFIFAGASQLAAIDLMTQGVSSFVIIATGITINLRFLLYSASLAKPFQSRSFLIKTFASYSLTDQSYAILMANESKLSNQWQKSSFYLGSAIAMMLTWQLAVLLGFIFGNFAPNSFSLEYAVPLSFVALLIPTLKSRNYIYVAITSSILSILLKPLPLNLGLILSALLALFFGVYLNNKERAQYD